MSSMAYLDPFGEGRRVPTRPDDLAEATRHAFACGVVATSGSSPTDGRRESGTSEWSDVLRPQ